YTVTDANGCTASASATINAAPTQLVLTATPTQPNCFGQTGSVNRVASGGTAPYNYNATSTSNLGAGTYNYTVTDANGCTASVSAIINAAPTQLVLTATATQPNCFGQTGSVNRVASGGTAPYNYNATATSNLGAGTYSYTVTDAKGCTANASATITVPTAITASASTTPSGCGVSTGSATVTVGGGTPGYTYLWTPSGKTTQTATALSAGTYSVLVTDTKGCTKTENATVGQTGSAPAMPAWYPHGTDNPTIGVCGGSTYEYEIYQSSGATSYTWTAPTGCTISDGLGHSGNPLTFQGQNAANEWEVYILFPSGFVSGSVTVQANNACGSSTANTLAVQSKPNTPGTISGSTSVCKSNTSKVYSIAAVTGATSYTWTITGGAQFVGSSTGASVTVKYTNATSTSATLSVKANNACGSSAAKTLAITVNLGCRDDESVTVENNLSAISDLNLYPNPTSGNVQITFVSVQETEYTIKVVDLLGKEISKEIFTAVEGNNLANLDLSNLSKGLYFVSVIVEGEEIKTMRLAIQ
ncbi:MAG: T9SS type A sorting domain-containing protein, partial [Bacteroidota bacterium]